jgi:hypothetical protein
MTVQNGTPGKKRRRTNKPQELVEKAAVLRLEGKSDRQIARELHVKPNTVPNMLSESELLAEFRRKLRAKIPKALENLDLLLTPGMGQSVEELGRTTRWVLENTQVGVKKEERDVTQRDEVRQLSVEELRKRIAEKLAAAGITR